MSESDVYRPSWNHMESILYRISRTRARACEHFATTTTTTRREATRRDTQPTPECYPGQCPVSKVQFFLEQPFLKPRFSEDLPGNRYDNTGSDRCYVETDANRFALRIVSRPFHGRSARPSKFFGDSERYTRRLWGNVLGIFPEETTAARLLRRQIKSL